MKGDSKKAQILIVNSIYSKTISCVKNFHQFLAPPDIRFKPPFVSNDQIV